MIIYKPNIKEDISLHTCYYVNRITDMNSFEKELASYYKSQTNIEQEFLQLLINHSITQLNKEMSTQTILLYAIPIQQFKVSGYTITSNMNLNESYYTLEEYIKQKLNTIYKNLLLTEDTKQLSYAIQYCNHPNASIKSIAEDILHNQKEIVIENKKLLSYILDGNIDLIEELTK